MASLSAFELALHQAQRLPCGEDSFPGLMVVSVDCAQIFAATAATAATGRATIAAERGQLQAAKRTPLPDIAKHATLGRL